MQLGKVADIDLHLPSQQRLHRGRRSLVGHVQQFDPRPRREHRPTEMGEGAETGGGVGQFSRIGLGMSDEHGGARRRQVGVDGERDDAAAEHADGGKILPRIVLHLLDQRRDGDLCDGTDQQGLPVGLRSRDMLGPNRSTRAGAVLDDEGLREHLPHVLCQRPRGQIDDASGIIGHDQRDRPARPVLRPSGLARHKKQAGDQHGPRSAQRDTAPPGRDRR